MEGVEAATVKVYTPLLTPDIDRLNLDKGVESGRVEEVLGMETFKALPQTPPVMTHTTMDREPVEALPGTDTAS